MREHFSGQRGNAIFIVLLAVALFAALGFAISTGRNTMGNTVTQEEARLAAEELIQYGLSMRLVVEKMSKGGYVADTAFSFAATGAHAGYGAVGASPGNEVFHVSGGGATYMDPPAGSCTAPCVYDFTGQIRVEDVGDDADYDLVMLVSGLDATVCTMINRIEQKGWASVPTEAALTLTRFDGNYGASNTIHLGGTNAAVAGHRSLCYQESAGGQRYIFVYVLKAR